MKPMKYASLILLSFFCFFVVAPKVNAQFNSPLKTAVTVTLNPENPGPNEVVYVNIDSYGTNLDAALITWKINDKIIKSGKGQKNFSFTTGSMNTSTHLEVTAVTTEDEIITQTYDIKPTSVDLLWQATGYTPPFYKGKTFFSHEDQIQFVALPHMLDDTGKEIPASDLIYKWTQNGSVLADASGYGKNVFSTVGSIISRSLDVEVEVTSPTQNGVGTAEVVASPIEPQILMYKKDPSYGIEFQKALVNDVNLLNTKEISVIGVPFFFGTTDPSAPYLQYTWSINGETIDGAKTFGARVFLQKEGTSGASNVSLAIENTNKILQYATNNFNLSFGQ